MPITKANPKFILEMREQISFLRAQRDRIAVLKEGRELPFWKALQGQLESVIKNVSSRMDASLSDSNNTTGSDASFANLKQWYGTKAGAELILSWVNNSDDQIDKITNRIKALEGKIAEAVKQEEEQ